MPTPLPTAFISHGAPSLVLESSPSRDFLAAFGSRLGRPRAILCVSAHWETSTVGVTLAPNPKTIHDFHGFPPELHRMQYSAPGDYDLGARAIALLSDADIPAWGESARGIDHGVWSPLALIFPDASIPVVEMSVQPGLGPEHHYRVGRALAALRDEDVLILGSGSMTHNLRELGRPAPHAQEFERWVCEAATEGRTDDLLHCEESAPSYARNHPTPEHFLPLFVPLGAAGAGATCEALNREFEYESLSMAALIWRD